MRICTRLSTEIKGRPLDGQCLNASEMELLRVFSKVHYVYRENSRTLLSVNICILLGRIETCLFATVVAECLGTAFQNDILHRTCYCGLLCFVLYLYCFRFIIISPHMKSATNDCVCNLIGENSDSCRKDQKHEE